MDIQTAKQIFDAHDGIMKSKEIIENKIYSRFLKRLIAEGYVEKIKFGYYQWQDERAFREVTIMARLFPDAVLCMVSALQYYSYTERTPAAWCLAVDKHSTKSRFNIDYPMVKPHYIPEEQMTLGVEAVMIEDTELKIFNKAIQAYIKDPKKNVPRLMEYAKILRTENKVRKIIGVWL